MSYAQLKAFHAVARHGGFSKAARELSLTQPAVSDHVRKLEEEHGVQLFIRNRNGVVMTETGRKLFTITERQFEAEGEAVDLLTRAGRLEEGAITIGADAAVHVLPAISRFRQLYPRVEVKLIAGNSAGLMARLLNLHIDVAVTAGQPVHEAVSAHVLRRYPLVAVVNTRENGNKPRNVTLAQLVSMPFVLREEGSVTRNLLLDELARRGLKPPRSIEIEGREAVCEAVAQGLGVAVMSAGEVMSDSRIAAVPIRDWNGSMEEWLLTLKARGNLHLIQSFTQAALSFEKPSARA